MPPLLVNQQIYAAFTLNGFNNQVRKVTFVKTDFQVLKLKFHACNFLSTLSILFIIV